MKVNENKNCNKGGENIINDGVEVSARESQARFQSIQVLSSAEPPIRLQ